jgi:hypothetical protein
MKEEARMRQKRLKSQRTRILERDNKRCEARHPNWLGVRCEYSVDEFHHMHIGENGYWMWWQEIKNPERRLANID